MQPPAKLLGETSTADEASARRAANRELIAANAVDGGTEEHYPSPKELICAHCDDAAAFRQVGDGRETVLYDYVPGYFRRTHHVVHTAACSCGRSTVNAQGPARATSRSRYGTGLAAYLIASKFSMSMPIHRLEKQLRSHGIPVSRSTLNELVNRVAERLRPVYEVLCSEVRHARVVHADETPIKILSHDKQGYIWVFLSGEVIIYKFAEGRGSITALDMLGDTEGVLVTDGYAGYLPVTSKATADQHRIAAACLAHIRRKFHDALSTAPEAQTALDLILEVYKIEREVAVAGMVASAEHLILRQPGAGPVMEKLKRWMRSVQKSTPPKSPLGKAISYALGRWTAAVRFLYDASIAVDNNISERALRVVALGRKNFNGVGSKEGGRALEVLYSLVSSCEAAGVEPFAYLQDVIARAEQAPETLTPKAWAASQTPEA